MSFSVEKPWIPERETILDAWKPDYNRGYINNMNVNLSTDWYSMSNRQISEYAKMMKSFGFTGIQMTDGCSHWRWFDSYEPDHDRKKVMAQALHSQGMKASLWVWASCFTGHGWSDPSVVYQAKDGGSAYDDPDVFASFNKYYDIYADLAPYFDRLIMHFFDPGRLDNYSDIFRFAKLLESKFKAVNPDIQICIDTWSAPDDFPMALAEAGLGDYMLMEIPFLPSWGRPGRRAAFREKVKKAGATLGVWSWYTADIEIDQNARWVVNPNVIKYIYNQTRQQGDHVMTPSYWSEMDSYHVLNLFSLYCAGQLLIDPEREPDDLLDEIAHKIYGDKYGDDVLKVLHLIEDARAGRVWDDYWWGTPYDPGVKMDFSDIHTRAADCLDRLRPIVADIAFTTAQPLPVTPAKLAELMIAHVDQLERYTRFRLDMQRLDRERENGADKDYLSAEVTRIWDPIPDFNAIIGVWGQPESRVQAAEVYRFCVRAGIPMPEKKAFIFKLKKWYYEYLVSEYKAYGNDVVSDGYYEGHAPFGFLEDQIFKGMEEDGLIERLPGGKIKLLHTDHYRYK